MTAHPRRDSREEMVCDQWGALVKVKGRLLHFYKVRPEPLNLDDEDDEGRRVFAFDYVSVPQNLLIC